jgi:hypothetical protein
MLVSNGVVSGEPVGVSPMALTLAFQAVQMGQVSGFFDA